MLNSAAITEFTTNSCVSFDAKINNWAEGVLLTLDADHSRLTIRGTERPYASEYAKMLKAIHEKTEGMTQSDRSRESSEIRLNWKGALEKAHAKEALADRDITFQLHRKESKLLIIDETPFYNREPISNLPLATTVSLTEEECKAIHELNNLKVGEWVVVGYDGRVFRNDAYVVIKANKC